MNDYCVLIFGGRDFANAEGLVRDSKEWLDKKHEYLEGISYLDTLACKYWPRLPEDEYGNWLPAVTVISGGAKGADALGESWAIVNWTGLKCFPADWNKYGKSAGMIRNQQMLEEGKPTCAVQFPGGKGTAHMRKLLDKAGVLVWDYSRSSVL